MNIVAWGKVPQSLRSNFSKNVTDELTKFPADWPEVEFLAVAGFFGYQKNYIRDAPTDCYNYATMAVALVAPPSRGTVTISSANTNDQPVINPTGSPILRIRQWRHCYIKACPVVFCNPGDAANRYRTGILPWIASADRRRDLRSHQEKLQHSVPWFRHLGDGKGQK